MHLSELIDKISNYSPKALFTLVIYRLVISKKWFLALMPDKFYDLRVPGGKMCLNLSYSAMWAYWLGIYEFQNTKLFAGTIKPSMTVIDIGANKGYFTLLASRLLNGDGQVFAVEPDPQNCLSLERNIKLNNYDICQVFQMALSDKDAEAELYLGRSDGANSIIESWEGLSEEKKHITVTTMRLDSFIEEKNIGKVDFIKVDVEGAELDLLMGAENCLSSNDSLMLLISIHKGVDRQGIYDLLHKYNYSLYGLDRNYNEVSADDFVNTQISDILACNDSSLIDRVKRK